MSEAENRPKTKGRRSSKRLTIPIDTPSGEHTEATVALEVNDYGRRQTQGASFL